MMMRNTICGAVLIVSGLLCPVERAHGQNAGTTANMGGPYTLERCIQIALANNPQIEIARKGVEVQQANLFSSYTGVMPVVNATVVSANRTTSGDTPVIVEGVVLREAPGSTRTNYGKGVFMRMDLYNGGRNWNTIRQARQLTESEEFAQNSTEHQVIVNVKTSYYGLLRALRLKEVTEEQVRLNEEQLRRSRSMYEIGSVARVDVLQTTAQLGAVRISLRNQENSVLQARAELANVMGIGSSEVFDIVDPLEDRSLDTSAHMSLQDALRLADLTNPAIQRDEGRIRSAMLGTKMARGGLWPTVTGTIAYNRSGVRFQDVYGTYDKNWRLSFGLNLSLPILNGTQTYAEISRAQAQQLIAEETLRQTRRTTTLTIRTALLDLETAGEVIGLSNDNIAFAEESLRLAEERYRVGSGTLLDVFTAQEALARAKYELVGAQYDYLIAQARLDGALGKQS